MQDGKTLVIEAPWSAEIGDGHIIRELALAQAAKELGYKVVLWTSARVATQKDYIKSAIELYFHQVVERDNHIPTVEECQQLVAKAGNISMVVVDNWYGLGDPEKRKARIIAWSNLKEQVPHALFAVTDGHEQLKDEFDVFDAIVNYDVPMLNGSPYPNLAHKMVGGFDVALVRGDFFKPLNELPELPQPIYPKSFAIMLGGGDPLNLATPVLESLVDSGCSPVLVSPEMRRNKGSGAIEPCPNNPFYERELAKYDKWIWFKNGLTAGQMARLFQEADFAVISASTAPLAEVFVSGCPSIAIAGYPCLFLNSAALKKLGYPVIDCDRAQVLAMEQTTSTIPPAGVTKETIAAALKQMETMKQGRRLSSRWQGLVRQDGSAELLRRLECHAVKLGLRKTKVELASV